MESSSENPDASANGIGEDSESEVEDSSDVEVDHDIEVDPETIFAAERVQVALDIAEPERDDVPSDGPMRSVAGVDETPDYYPNPGNLG